MNDKGRKEEGRRGKRNRTKMRNTERRKRRRRNEEQKEEAWMMKTGSEGRKEGDGQLGKDLGDDRGESWEGRKEGQEDRR